MTLTVIIQFYNEISPKTEIKMSLKTKFMLIRLVLTRYMFVVHIFTHDDAMDMEANMERLLLKKLIDWKEKKTKKPLIIKGARQVGKTHLIREFGNGYYSNVVEINFERQLEYVELFQKTRYPQDILNYLQISFPSVKFDAKTLLFFDEIQACSSALTANF